jgi:phosphoserine phosphatase
MKTTPPHPWPPVLPEHDATRGVCRVYLVRHGRTVMNVEVRFRGRLEVPLDDQGRREAWMAARTLANAGICAVYTSPLDRAREVARAICHETGVSGYEDMQGLLNLDYGDWHGLTKEEAAYLTPEAWRLYREEPERAVCPNGEALAEAANRVRETLLAIGRRHRGQAVAAVSHGVMVRLAALRAAGRPPGDWEIPLATGSATVFEVLDGGLSLVHVPKKAQPDSDGVAILDGKHPVGSIPLTPAESRHAAA